MGGEAPSSQPVQLSPPVRPPGFGFAQSFANNILPGLVNQPLPSYQGQLDPGLSPTLQNAIRGSQQYMASPMPDVMGQSAGALGQFMNVNPSPWRYEQGPEMGALYNFMNPAFEDPMQAMGQPPDYGFGRTNRQGGGGGLPSPLPGSLSQVSQMAEGGGGGYGAERIVKMQAGGAGGLGSHGIPIIPGNHQPAGVHQGPGGYWWDGGSLAHNPNPSGGGMLENSRWGNFWDWAQGATGFTPGAQHGPNAQFWNAVPPAGFDYGRGGTVNPTDPANPRGSPYGWWSAEPGGQGFQVNPQGMPPWLRGLNDEQMQQVFDLNNIPGFMQGPGDQIGEEIAGRQSMDFGGSQGGPAGGGRGRGGGGGGGPDLQYQGIPGYQPVSHQPEFVAWDPGNPTPSMVPGNTIMPPEPPAFWGAPPPQPEPAPPGPPGGGGGGGGGNAGGGGRPPQGPPAPQQPPPPMFPFNPFGPEGLFPGGLGLGGSGGGMNPGNTAIGNEVAVPAMERGGISDKPQLALIGEAGPEVVLPLTRKAAHPSLQKMQQQLGLPATEMQSGGGGGMADWTLQDWQKPGIGNWFKDQRAGKGLSTDDMGAFDAWRGMKGFDPIGGNSLATKPGTLGGPQSMTGGGLGQGGMGGNSLATKPGTLPGLGGADPGSASLGLGGGNSMATKPGQLPPSRSPFQPSGSYGNSLATKPGQMTGGVGGIPGSGGGGGQPSFPIPGAQGSGQQPFGPTSAMDVFRTAAPVMNDVMSRQIEDATSQAGLSGNRFSTSMANTAGRIGQEAGNQLTNMMGNLLYNQTQSDLDRALQSTGMGLQNTQFMNQLGLQAREGDLNRGLQASQFGPQLGMMMDQMQRNRLQLPFDMGRYEQQRQDMFSQIPYQDFMQSRQGWLPMAMQFASSQGGGYPGQFGVQQSGGSPGAMDFMLPIMSMFMMGG